MVKYADLEKENGKVRYRGRLWSINEPVPSDRPGKKKMVLAKKGDEVKLVHFGAKGYGHNYSDKAKQNYLSRSAGIRNGSGELTKNDPFSPNYWARKVLWPSSKPATGPSDTKKDSDLKSIYYWESLGETVNFDAKGKKCGGSHIASNKKCLKGSGSSKSPLTGAKLNRSRSGGSNAALALFAGVAGVAAGATVATILAKRGIKSSQVRPDIKQSAPDVPLEESKEITQPPEETPPLKSVEEVTSEPEPVSEEPVNPPESRMKRLEDGLKTLDRLQKEVVKKKLDPWQYAERASKDLLAYVDASFDEETLTKPIKRMSSREILQAEINSVAKIADIIKNNKAFEARIADDILSGEISQDEADSILGNYKERISSLMDRAYEIDREKITRGLTYVLPENEDVPKKDSVMERRRSDVYWDSLTANIDYDPKRTDAGSKKCGGGYIPANKTCRKGGGSGSPARLAREGGGSGVGRVATTALAAAAGGAIVGGIAARSASKINSGLNQKTSSMESKIADLESKISKKMAEVDKLKKSSSPGKKIAVAAAGGAASVIAKAAVSRALSEKKKKPATATQEEEDVSPRKKVARTAGKIRKIASAVERTSGFVERAAGGSGEDAPKEETAKDKVKKKAAAGAKALASGAGRLAKKIKSEFTNENPYRRDENPYRRGLMDALSVGMPERSTQYREDEPKDKDKPCGCKDCKKKKLTKSQCACGGM